MGDSLRKKTPYEPNVGYYGPLPLSSELFNPAFD